MEDDSMKLCYSLITFLLLFSAVNLSVAGEAEKQLIKDAAKYLYSPSDKDGQEGMDGILDYSKKRVLGDTGAQSQNQGKCPQCGRLFPADYKFCPYDGKPLDSHSHSSSEAGSYSSTAKNESITNFMGMKFVFIPSGSFTMGSPIGESHRRKDELQHEVTISKGFYMGETEITIGQWKQVRGENPVLGKKWNGDEYPVIGVSWYDAQKFIKKLNSLDKDYNYRLPTEAEWEYACRAGSEDAYSWGDMPRCEKANYGNFHGSAPHQRRCVKYIRSIGLSPGPVPGKKFPPNAWGLYDMNGNVREWVHDYKRSYPEEPQIDPTGPESGSSRVLRGGYWGIYAHDCRCAKRSGQKPDVRYGGFRLVLAASN
jgi:formylglycine-generating enzyme required for sulfatase activity